MALGLKRKGIKPAQAPVKDAAPSKVVAKINIAPNPPVKAGHRFAARQLAFMDHYMVSRNATDAATKAGLSKKTAHVQGSRLLSNVRIRAELDRRIAAQSKRLEIDADWVIQRLARIADSSLGNYLSDGVPDLSAMTPDQAYALGSVTVEEFKDGRSDKREVRRTKVALGDREKCLELLGKRLKLFGDTVEHDHRHELTLFQLMLDQIDAESRGKPLVIEHQK